MSETAQILFNSPALHSLKRDQLVKLCKIHSLKASGKNVEIIERLKQHAQKMPPGDPLSVAARSEQPADEDEDMEVEPPSPPQFGHVRPSEQWEIVMDDIEEEEGSSRGGTLNSLRSVSGRSAGEFGTGSSKSSSVSSSIKALATSLGLKRAMSSATTASLKSNSTRSTATSSSLQSLGPNDDLAHFSTPYDALPETSPSSIPQTDHFTLSTDPDTSLPGQGGRAGMPAPANARLSTGAGATTTIRLVSMPSTQSSSIFGALGPSTPQLKPFSPAFDLLLGSPGGENEGAVPVWPLSPGGAPSPQRLYPSLAAFSEDKGTPISVAPPRITVQTPAKSTSSSPTKTRTPRTFPTPSNEPNDIFSPAPAATLGVTAIPRSTPFVFGSPLPQNNVSNKAFGNAAASVLEEMNRRLSAVGAQKVGTEILERGPTSGTNATGSTSGAVQEKVQDRFARVHEEQFNKMESIATHYAARRGANKRKSDVLGRGAPAARKRVSAETRVISAGGRKRMGIPGGFGDDDEDHDDEEEGGNAEENRRMSKRVRVSEVDGGVGEGRRVSIAPTEKDKKKSQKEREAVRKMLEEKREKRRSSIRRVSGVAPLPVKNKGTTSRFGFISSAKSMVRSVWNMGGTNSKAAASVASSSIPVPKPAPVKPAAPQKKEVKPASVMRKPSLASLRPSTLPNPKTETTSRIPSGGATGSTSGSLLKPPSNAATSSKAGPSSARSRSPLPAFGSTSTKSGIASGTHSRNTSITSIASAKPLPPSSTSSRLSTRPSSINGPSSLGTKGSAATRASSAGGVSSIGTRRNMAPPGTIPSKPTMSSFGKVSSRLFAPTASSLAKTRTSITSQARASGSLIGKAASPKTSAAPASPLDQITNSPPRAPAPRKDSPGRIFSKPLSAASSPSLIPSPVRPTSLSAAASSLACLGSPSSASAKPASTSTAAVPAKPRVLAARKPRISRSRVIAKLGAQRAAAAAGTSNPTVSASAPRTRSSIGTGVRRSYGGAKIGKARGSDVVMSAKKRARQSEYMRRRSRAAGSAVGTSSGGTSLFSGVGDGSASMDIDDD